MIFRVIKRNQRKAIVSIASKQNVKDCSSLRKEIVEYALQFKGNPYVFGGTSLTKGTDCSGFTQSVFKSKGIRLPRTSGEQAKGGKDVPLKDLKPGDLIFYTKKRSDQSCCSIHRKKEDHSCQQSVIRNQNIKI